MLFFKKKNKSKDVVAEVLNDITFEEPKNTVAPTEDVKNDNVKVSATEGKTTAKKTAKATAPKSKIAQKTVKKTDDAKKQTSNDKSKKTITDDKSKTTTADKNKKQTENAKKPVKKDADDSKKKAQEKAFSGKVYHVTFRKDLRKWQVILGKGERAIKQFFTQGEAIDYAKELAEKNNGNMVIHMLDGKIRKQSYNKKKQDNDSEK